MFRSSQRVGFQKYLIDKEGEIFDRCAVHHSRQTCRLFAKKVPVD